MATFRNISARTLSTRLTSSPLSPKYRENQVGGTFGGRIIKDKLFFFVDTETNLIRQGTASSFYDVPTALERQGIFSEPLNTSLTGNAQPVHLFEPGTAGTVPLTCNGQANVMRPSQIDPVAHAMKGESREGCDRLQTYAEHHPENVFADTAAASVILEQRDTARDSGSPGDCSNEPSPKTRLRRTHTTGWACSTSSRTAGKIAFRC